MRGDHRNAVGDRRLDDVGQVVLALGVVAASGREPALQVAGRRGHHAGVDLADRAIGRAWRPCARRSVDARRPRARRGRIAAHDSTVAARVGQLDASAARAAWRRRRPPARAQSRSRSAARRRSGSASCRRRRAAARLLHRMAGAELRVLARERRAVAPRTEASTLSASYPVMTTMRRALSPDADSRTCCNRLSPASRCSTFGDFDRMRVPLPAAMTTMSSATSSLPCHVPCCERQLSRRSAQRSCC